MPFSLILSYLQSLSHAFFWASFFNAWWVVVQCFQMRQCPPCKLCPSQFSNHHRMSGISWCSSWNSFPFRLPASWRKHWPTGRGKAHFSLATRESQVIDPTSNLCDWGLRQSSLKCVTTNSIRVSHTFFFLISIFILQWESQACFKNLCSHYS